MSEPDKTPRAAGRPTLHIVTADRRDGGWWVSQKTFCGRRATLVDFDHLIAARDYIRMLETPSDLVYVMAGHPVQRDPVCRRCRRAA